jgi:oligosaccharide repeat unit polymerase
LLLGFSARGVDVLDDGGAVFTTLASYTVTHPFAFSDWLSRYLGGESSLHYYDATAPAGYYTFTPLFNLLGIRVALPDGTYAEYFSQDEVLAGNIYTMYRGLIVDFGVGGSFVVMTLLGVVFGQIFRQCKSHAWAPLSAALYCFSFGFLQQSTLISFAMYRSFYVGIAILAILVALVWSFERKQDLKVS